MLSPIVSQGMGYKNNTIAFVASQGFGVFDSTNQGGGQMPVVVLDTGEIAEYINQSITQIRNGRVAVAYQKRRYNAFNYGNGIGSKTALNNRFSPQFGVSFDRYNECDQ